jgi:hypothetical protein
VTRTAEEKWLQAIATAAAANSHAQTQLRHAVTAARNHGVAWKLIGEVLGVSRQAAQQRFKGIQ